MPTKNHIGIELDNPNLKPEYHPWPMWFNPRWYLGTTNHIGIGMGLDVRGRSWSLGIDVYIHDSFGFRLQGMEDTKPI